MGTIENISVNPFITPYHTGASRPAEPAPSAPSRPSEDAVELSRTARLMSRGYEPSSFSAARLQAIRSEIQAGTYETPERIAATVDRLIDVLA